MMIKTKVSIIIPVHKSEEVGYIKKTLDGIVSTIGIPVEQYSITLVGTLPDGMFSSKTKAKYNFLPTNALLGDAKNQGAKYAMTQHDPDVLVFMDAHMYFFDKESNNWGGILHSFLMAHPNTIAAPAIAVYDNVSQRGHGVIGVVDEKTMDLKWVWWGSPGKDNKPFEVPGACGCFMSMSPAVFNDSVCGYTPPSGADDREFSIRMWLLGKDFYNIPALTVGHRFASSYSYWNEERATLYGYGVLLFPYLNIGKAETKKMCELDLGGASSKVASYKMATSPYWRQVRDELIKKMVRTPEQYYKRFKI